MQSILWLHGTVKEQKVLQQMHNLVQKSENYSHMPLNKTT